MSYGEDEVDYGEEEIGDRSALPSSAGEVSAFMEDHKMVDQEEEEEADYDDLYDDVNIGHFEPFPEKKKAADGGGNFGTTAFDEDEVAIQAPLPVYGSSSNLTPPHPVKEETLKQEKPGLLPVLKQEVVDDVEIKPLGIPQYQEGAVSKGQAPMLKDEKPQPGSWRSDIRVQLRDENDAPSKGPTQKALSSATFLSQGRAGVTSNPEPAGKEVNYAGADDTLASGATSMVVNIDVRGRATGRPMDAERGFGAVGRPSQGTGNRDSSATVGIDYTVRHGNSLQSGDGAGSGSGSGGGGTMLFVGDLEWWTTDAELEAALSEFGSIKGLKFFEERASGKSKGYCQVEFYDHSAAAACKEGMNGRKFHGRSCLVAFANPKTVIHLGNVQVGKAQAQIQAQQAQMQSRRSMNDSGGSNRGAPYQGGDNARGYGRMTGSGRGGVHGQGAGGRGIGRGRTNLGNKGLSGNGGSGAGGAAYGQGLVGPMGSHPSGMMMPQAMLGQGYDAGFGPPRAGAGYGGYVLPGPPFTGMMPPFATMGPGTLAGVAPHVNPAFFGRNATTGGMGMMAGNGLDVWGDGSMNGWGTEEPDRRAREVGYGDDLGGSDYGYNNEMSYEKGRGGNRDKDWDRGADGDWSEKWRRDERESEKERYKDRDGYKDQREREWDMDDDWEREKSLRTRNKSRMIDEEDKEDQRPRSRDEDYGKRRRMGSER